MKYVMHNYYVSPFGCLLFMGIGTFILIIISYIIYSLICFKDFSIIIDAFNLTNKIIYLYLFLVFIDIIIFEVIEILVIFYFSPLLLMATDIINPILNLTFEIIIDNAQMSILYKILTYIGYFIIFICALIYNEIIICNFCDLNKNTSKYIKERQKEELASIGKIGNDNDSENGEN